jgi:hypothetical protein
MDCIMKTAFRAPESNNIWVELEIQAVTPTNLKWATTCGMNVGRWL